MPVLYFNPFKFFFIIKIVAPKFKQELIDQIPICYGLDLDENILLTRYQVNITSFVIFCNNITSTPNLLHRVVI